MGVCGLPVPRDWTQGTGVFPTSGTISVSAEPDRNSILIQCQNNSNPIYLLLPAEIPNTGAPDTGGVFDTSTTATISVVQPTGPTAARVILSLSSQQGIFTDGPFQVVGTSGSAVVVITN